jgi:hypothetical protein
MLRRAFARSNLFGNLQMGEAALLAEAGEALAKGFLSPIDPQDNATLRDQPPPASDASRSTRGID